MWVPWYSPLLLLTGAALCAAKLKDYDWQSDITCSQALNHCAVFDKNCVLPPCDDGLPPCTSTLLEVSDLDVEAAFCSKTTSPYKACLRVGIRLRVPDDDDDVSGKTPDDSEDDECAALTLCYIFPPNLQSCKEINFTLKSSALRNQEEPEVMVMVQDAAFLGNVVTVTVNAMLRNVHFPSLSKVCPSPHIEECATPKLLPEIDAIRGVLELKTTFEEPLLMCVKKKKMSSCELTERILPLHTVTHCMCFQAWRINREHESIRSEICPFENHTEFRRNAVRNVSLSVEHFETNEGWPALKWNVSAPCTLEMEVWPCQMAVHLGGGCREVPTFRRNVGRWTDGNISTVWTSGEFLNVTTTSNLLPCVMFKVDGEMLGPVCEHHTPRGRWICLAIGTLLLVVLLAAGVCVLRVRYEEWLSNSNPTHHSQGLGGEVLLVHSSGSDPSFSDTVCWFASWLSELGFSVSLDLWNQADVSKLGPTPWLHSRLHHVQKSGGKTLLLLSDEAVLRAESYSESWTRASNSAADGARDASWPCNTDVFTSALGALMSASLQGGAAEHFALVQLESTASELPELFRSLKLYQLPSESQQLLADLHMLHPGSFGARLKRFLWTWKASTRLETMLRNCRNEQKPCSESTLTDGETQSVI